MSIWVLRGLRDGVVTTKWPRKPDEYADAFREPVTVRPGADLAGRTGALRRSVHVRHVDAGSDGSVEWEIQALLGPVYDIHRLGIFFTASPRHADVLLVTGAGTAGMAGPLRETYEGMPDPKVVVAVGDDARAGSLEDGPPEDDGDPPGGAAAGVGRIVPVDVWVGGSPPSPFAILKGLLTAVNRL